MNGNMVPTLTINSIGAQGDGLATHDGKPVYVPKTAPGDVAQVKLDSLSSDSYNGKLIAIETPGPDRAPPPCPYFNQCGGCALQHVDEKFYRDWKTQSVKTTLERAGVKVEKWEAPVFLPAATRRRTSAAALKTSKGVVFGYNEERSHHILDIHKCLILDPALDAKMQALRPYLPRLLPELKTCDITLQYAGGAFDMVLTGPLKFAYEQHEALGELAETLDIARISFREKDFRPLEPLLNRKQIFKKFGTLTIELPPAAFLQASEAGEKTLSDIVVKHAGDAKNIADLFSGCGTFAGALAQNAKITAADAAPDAMAALARAKHPNIKVHRRDLFKTPLASDELSHFDCIVFDPPRAGAREQALHIAQTTVPRVIAVSCNPATFARDAKILQEGGYMLQSMTVVDQFVYSAHVEVVGMFTMGR